MKKTMVIILSIMMIMNFTVIAEASDFSTGLSGGSSIDKGATFNVDITVNSSKELYGVEGKLNFDSSKLELVSSEGKNGFALTVGTSVVADTSNPKKGSFTVGTLRFKAKSGLSEGNSTKISIGGIQGSDGVSTLSGSGASRTVSVKVPPKAPAPKPAPTPKSSNSNLASLSVSPGSISFNKNTTSYSMTVENSVDNLTVQASAEDSKARVSGTGNKNLSVYGNRINITVTAENGSEKTYTINVTRKDERGSTEPLSGNADLKSLEVEGYPLEFSKDTLEYQLDVKNHIPSVTVNAAADHSDASVDIEKPEELALGENEITVTVTAENGSEKSYTIIVNRDDAPSVITMEELEDAIRNSTVKEVIVLQDDAGIIDEDLLQLLKDQGKNLVIRAQDEEGETIYEWVIDGEAIEDISGVKTLLAFDCETREEIIEAANFAQGMILAFDHNDALPKGTSVRINVGKYYPEGTLINLYYYENPEADLEGLSDEEIEELMAEGPEEENPFQSKGQYLVDEEGFVTISLEHTSRYFLTRAVLVEEPEEEAGTKGNSRSMDHNIFIYLSGLQFLAIIGMVVYQFQIRRKRQ